MPRTSFGAERHAAAVARRWLEWLPSISLHCRRSSDHAACVVVLRRIHSLRCSLLTAADIHWPTIRARRLDSPLQSKADFERTLAHMTERHRYRVAMPSSIRQRKEQHDRP